jgi:hypothetical protein
MTSTFEVYSPVETIGQAPDSTLSRHAVQTVMAEVLGVGVDDALLQDRLGRAASGNETVTIPGITTYISPGSTIAMTAEAAELQQDPRAVQRQSWKKAATVTTSLLIMLKAPRARIRRNLPANCSQANRS